MGTDDRSRNKNKAGYRAGYITRPRTGQGLTKWASKKLQGQIHNKAAYRAGPEKVGKQATTGPQVSSDRYPCSNF